MTGKKTITLTKGKKATIKATVTATPNKAANKKVTYKTSNKKVATVTKKGVVTAKKAGSAKITVTSTKNKKKTAKITVKVVAGKVTSVALDKKEASIVEGEKAALKATVKTKGKKPNKTLVWTSSDNTVATVDAKGNVTAVKAGKATITATATDGTKKKASCAVTVTAKPQPATPNTTLTVKGDAEMKVSVTLGTDAEGNVKELVKALGLQNGQKATVEVTGKGTKEVVCDGTTLKVGDKLLSEVAGSEVTVKVPNKYADKINLVAAFASKANASISIDGIVIKDVTVDAKGKGTATVNGTTLNIVSITKNVIVVEGDQKALFTATNAVTVEVK